MDPFLVFLPGKISHGLFEISEQSRLREGEVQLDPAEPVEGKFQFFARTVIPVHCELQHHGCFAEPALRFEASRLFKHRLGCETEYA
jgi:hypothetical protein